MEYIDLFEYKGEKVITTENIMEYELESIPIKHVKDRIYKSFKNETSIFLDHTEAKEYGQVKNFNYARGLWLFSVENVKKEIVKKEKSLSNILDLEALMTDICNGKIRRMSASKRNKPRNNKKKIENPTKEIKKQVVNEIKTSPLTTEGMFFDELYAFIDRLDEAHQRTNNQLIGTIRELVVKVDELSAKVDELTQLTTKVDDLKHKIEDNANEAISKAGTSILIMKEDSTYEEWKKNIKRAVKLISDTDGRTENEILHEAYDRLRSQYTIVWEQEAKEFREDFGRSPMNTMELCWWLETNKKVHKNLLIGKLNTIYSDAKRASIKIVE